MLANPCLSTILDISIESYRSRNLLKFVYSDRCKITYSSFGVSNLSTVIKTYIYGIIFGHLYSKVGKILQFRRYHKRKIISFKRPTDSSVLSGLKF